MSALPAIDSMPKKHKGCWVSRQQNDFNLRGNSSQLAWNMVDQYRSDWEQHVAKP